MGRPTGFLEHRRREPGYRPCGERLRDFNAVELQLSAEEITNQAARCMDCGTPFCHAFGCPLRNIIPELNDLAYRGHWKAALDLLLSTNNFPEFTGRICPALCEGSCVLGINDEPAAIRQIELAIIEKAFHDGILRPAPPKIRRPEKIAVIGSGPAGLAAADMLNHAGYRVTIFDGDPKPGGILRYGIPDFKLEKWVIDRRVRLMSEEGVEFEMRAAIGDDISARFLQSRFNVILLAGGARQPRDLNAPGRGLPGIHFALDYLIGQNLRNAGEALAKPSVALAKEGELPADTAGILADNKNVVIIGGGDTGSDCLGTALRQGAKQVYQIEILPKPPPARSATTPWPLWPHMLRESSSHKEGGKRFWGVLAGEFIGSNGKLSAVRCVEVEWSPPEKGKPPVMKEKTGSEFELQADLALIAMGFTGCKKNRFIADLNIEQNERGLIPANDDFMTSAPNIFVAGDMARGASLVVHAIADGRKAAAGILRRLSR